MAGSERPSNPPGLCNFLFSPVAVSPPLIEFARRWRRRLGRLSSPLSDLKLHPASESA